MGGKAFETIEAFWAAQDDGDYTATVELFADDAVLVDPIYGTYQGKSAIGAFMAKMNEAMGAIDASFRLVELAGDDETAWAQWQVTTKNGDRNGVGIYRVRDGRITYYRDYMNEPGL